MTRSRLPDVEPLACAVAGEYAARWARSVVRMQARADGAADAPGAWVVDGYAGADLQRAAMRGATVQAPAAAFVRAAREAFGHGARIVLVEEDPGLLARLEDELRRADGEPRRAANPADAAPGETVLVEAPFASVASRLAAEIADAPALVRLAPLTARALPWTALELLADLSGADLLLRFPQEDFARAGKFGGPLADFPPHLRRVVEGCSAFFADERHGWLLAWREAARAGGDDAALAGAVERLRAMLGNGGGERMARAARLEGAGGGAVHVILSTPHLEHALELNGAAADGGAPPPAPAKSAKGGRKSATSAAAKPDAAPAEASALPTPAGSAEAPPPAAEPAADSPGDVGPADVTSNAVEELASPARSRVPAAPPAAEPTPDGAPTPLDLFALEPPPFEVEPVRGPDLRAVADDLHERHAEQRVPFRELLMELADAGLAPEQVRAALGILKRDRRAAYRSLDADGAEVEFLAAPTTPPAPSAPRPKKARKPLPGVLGLFDEPEEEEAPGAPAEEDAGGSASAEPADTDAAEDAPAPARGKKARRRKAE